MFYIRKGNASYTKNENNIFCLRFKTQLRVWKANYSLNDSKEGWHYLAVKKLCALLRKAKSKHVSDFYFLNLVIQYLRYGHLMI